MTLKKTLLFIYLFVTGYTYSQEYIEINYKGTEGVILCQQYFSDRYRQNYDVYNLKPEQVYEFEEYLAENVDKYSSYVRKYQGLIKEGKMFLNSKLIKRTDLDWYSPNWKEDKTLYIHECDTRTIIYSFSEKRIITNRYNKCEGN